MATPIHIKRRDDPGLGGQLAEGELAYAYDSDELFVGSDQAQSNLLIGGASFISLLTSTPGVATADKAVILDSNTEIDSWNVAGLVEAATFKTSTPGPAGFVKNDASGNLLFGQTGEQSDLDLTDLADVTITTPSPGEYLCFDVSGWVNSAIPFNDLSDVVLTFPVSGEILSFTGTAWVNTAPATLPGIPTVLDDLTDVDTTTASPAPNDVLTFDGFLWVPLPSPSGGATDLDSLTDVTVTLPITGEFLRKSAGDWLNVSIVEADISDLQDYSLVGHTHVEADIQDLQAYLLDITGESIGSLSDVTLTFAVAGQFLRLGITDWENVSIVEADISDLQNYSLVGHTHLEADITDLQDYSLVGHTHVEADITDLQAYLLDITGESIDDLNDVDTTGVTTGEHLIFNGTNWVPVANDLIGLADTPPDYSGASLLFLRVDSGLSGVEFVSIGLSDLPAIGLDDLSDVSVATPSPGQFLSWTGSEWAPFTFNLNTFDLDDLNDVVISAPSLDEVLHFDGLNWVNDDPTTFGLVTVGASQTLTNKTLTTPNVDQINPTTTLVVLGDLSADDYSGINAALTGNLGAVDVTASGDVTAFDFKSTNPNATTPGFVKNSASGTLLYGQSVSLSLDDLTGVEVPTPTNNQLLTFVSGNNRWEAVSLSQVMALNDLTDVIIVAAAVGQVLEFDGSDWKNTATPRLDGVDASDTKPLVEFITNHISVNHSHLTIATGDAAGGPVISSASGFTADVDLQFHTQGTGGFRFLPGGSNPVQGFVKNDAQGELLLGQAAGISLDDLDSVFVPTPTDQEVLTFVTANNRWEAVLPSGGVASLNAIPDVDVPTPADGEVLKFNLSSGNWEAGADQQGPAALGGLTDVTLASPVSGEFLRHDGTDWKNTAVSLSDLPAITLDDLSDVNTPTPTDGQVLTWVNASSEWQSATPSGGGATELNDLTDVTITAPAVDSLLQFVGGQWIDQVNLVIDSTAATYWGGISTNTTWRVIRTGLLGVDLAFQRRESGVYKNKVRFTEGIGGDGAILVAFNVDADNNELIDWTSPTAFSVNHFCIRNAATGLDPEIASLGDDSNVGFTLGTKGTGKFRLQPGGTNPDAGLLGVDSNGRILFDQSGGGATQLNELSDVTITAAATGDFLRHNGTAWVDATIVDADVPDILTLSEIQDDEGNEVLTLTKIDINSTNFVDIFNVQTGSTPGIRSLGDDADVGFSFLTKGSGVFVWRPGGLSAASGFVKIASSGIMTFGNSITITDADVPNILTLTSVLDINGNTILDFLPTASAVNFIRINNTSTAFSSPALSAQGVDANISFRIATKGTGTFILQSDGAAVGLLGLDASGNILFDQSVSLPDPLVVNNLEVQGDIVDGNLDEILKLTGGFGQATASTATCFLEIKQQGSSEGIVKLIASVVGTPLNCGFEFITTGNGRFRFQENGVDPPGGAGLVRNTSQGFLTFGNLLTGADLADPLVVNNLEVQGDIVDGNLDEILKLTGGFGQAGASTSTCFLEVRQQGSSEGNVKLIASVVGTPANCGFEFKTTGSARFRFQENGVDPPGGAGLVRNTSQGFLTFSNLLTGADLADPLVVNNLEVQGDIVDSNLDEILKLTGGFGQAGASTSTCFLEVRQQGSSEGNVKLIASVVGTPTNCGFEFMTSGNGRFRFQENGVNPPGGAGFVKNTSQGFLTFSDTIALNDLSDVTITAAASGDFLRHNGSSWVDATIVDADVPNILTLTEILATNGFKLITFGGFGSSDGNLRITNAVTGSGIPVIMGSEGAATNIDLRFTTKGTGKFQLFPNSVAGAAGLLGLDGSGNLLFNKTITDDDVPNILTLTEILATNGFKLITFGGFGSSDGNLRITNAVTGSGIPVIMGSEGAATNIDLRFTTKGTGKFQLFPNSVAGAAGLLGLDSSGNILFGESGGASALDELSDVTITAAASGDFLRHNGSAWVDAVIVDADVPEALTLDSISAANTFQIFDANSNRNVIFNSVASAVNFFRIRNSILGTGPSIEASGAETDIDLRLLTKGAGSFVFDSTNTAAGLLKTDGSGNLLFAQSVTDAEVPDTLTIEQILNLTLIETTNGNNVLVFFGTGATVNYIRMTNALTGVGPTIESFGSDANIDLMLHAKGTGAVTIASGFDFTVAGGDAKFDDSIILTDASTDPNAVYWGDPSTNGSWRLILISGTLHSQKLITGTWTDEAIDGTP